MSKSVEGPFFHSNSLYNLKWGPWGLFDRESSSRNNVECQLDATR